MPDQPRNTPATNSIPHEDTVSRSVLWVSLIVFTIIWFVTLDYRHLLRPDEGRYAEIAREIFASGDWLTPRYNDYLYFEKPLLQGWMTALTYTLFGLGEWQARFWTGLTGYIGILAVGYTGAKIFSPRSGLFAAIILASSPMWSLGGHFNALDMGLSSMLCLALCALLLAQRAGATAAENRYWMWACWAFMALAVLSKGLIGIVLPGMVLVGYTLLARDWKLWTRLQLISGLVVFFAIAAPWHILVSQKNPSFAHFYFIHEHFERFTTNEHHRTGSVFYFIPLILVGFLPWIAQLPAAFKSAWKEDNEISDFRPALMLLVWAVLIFLFFSKSQSKLPGYIIPVFPALALLAGRYMALVKINFWRKQIGVFIAILAAGFAALPYVASLGKEPYQAIEYGHFVWWIAAGLAVGITLLIAAWRVAPRNFLASMALFAAGLFSAFLISGLGHETLGRSISGFDLAQRVKPMLKGSVPFYAVRGLDHTMPYYLERTMIMVEYPDELEFGVTQEPSKWEPTLASFVTTWNNLPQAYALMSFETYHLLQTLHVPMQELGRDERRIIVAKPAK